MRCNPSSELRAGSQHCTRFVSRDGNRNGRVAQRDLGVCLRWKLVISDVVRVSYSFS